MSTLLEGWVPSDLGFDSETFPDFREIQREMVHAAVNCLKAKQGAVLPPGSGKSLVANTIPQMTGERTVICTATKGLQQQYLDDFGPTGLVDIRGRSNYHCGHFDNMDCRDGARMGCKLFAHKNCIYQIAKAHAKEAQVVITNYDYWMSVNDHVGGLQRTQKEADEFGDNPVERLILDEGHHANLRLENYLSVRLYERDLEGFKKEQVPEGVDVSEWAKFSGAAVPVLEQAVLEMTDRIQEMGGAASRDDLRELNRLEGRLAKFRRLSGMKDDWVCDKWSGTRYGRIWAFDVVWAGRYAERYLFCGVPRVLIKSATLRKKTMALMGVRREDYDWQEWGPIYPKNRNPIYLYPAYRKKADGDLAGVRIVRRSTPEDYTLWMNRIDEIIGNRLDRKILILTVSYDRQRTIMDTSEYSYLMIGNTRGGGSKQDTDEEEEKLGADQAAEQFRKAEAGEKGAVLVSPSHGTGYDFPYSQCEVIIVAKVPFPDASTKVMKVRQQRDGEYGSYLTMQELVQYTGRGMRAFDDRCEVFIVDDSLSWFLWRNKHLAPLGFAESVKKIVQLPPRPKKL